MSIFLSYRREDSQEVTGRIYDRLISHFPSNCIFRDLDSLPIGKPFPLALDEAVTKASVALIIIGPAWDSITGINGQPRLDNPKDFVRLEVERVLSAAFPVIPVLISRATMPAPDVLPESLRPLVLLHAVTVRPDPDFHHDMDRLIAKLSTIVQKDEKKVLPANASLALAWKCGLRLLSPLVANWHDGNYMWNTISLINDNSTKDNVMRYVYSIIQDPSNEEGRCAFLESTLAKLNEGVSEATRQMHRMRAPSVTLACLGVYVAIVEQALGWSIPEKDAVRRTISVFGMINPDNSIVQREIERDKQWLIDRASAEQWGPLSPVPDEFLFADLWHLGKPAYFNPLLFQKRSFWEMLNPFG